ncbi:MAG: cobalamin biosynthesis protein CobW [Geminicoccaceae bacterium]|nr:cobalamin biosynthesis protein CobW [Geminicoccaceae bacterium]
MQKIPATIVTGFLGSGKTSLVQHLLQNAKGRRIALIVNEFGDVGVDSDLVRGCGDEACAEADIVELANGCICCTVADDFLPTMRLLLGRDAPPDHIVIETSGLALPKPLVKAFTWPEVRNRVTVDAVVAVVDAAAAAEGLFASDPDAVAAARAANPSLDHESPLEELFEEQLGSADMVVLNKLDLVGEEGRQAAEAAMAPHLRPGVKVVGARFGAVDPAAFLGQGAAAEDDLESRPSHHESEADHDHDDFESFVVDIGEAASADDLAGRVRAVAGAKGVLRVKGFAAIKGRPLRLAVQAVGGRVATYYDKAPAAARAGRLVVIGLAPLDRGAIEAGLRGEQAAA